MADHSVTGSGDQFLRTNLPTEVKSFTWQVDDFLNVMELDATVPKPKFEFDAGQSIGMPTTTKWRIELANFGNPDGYKYGITLERITNPGPEFANVHCKYEITMKTADYPNSALCISFEPTKISVDDTYRARFSPEQIKECLVNDDLTIQIKFVLYGQKFANSWGTSSPSSNNRKRKMIEESRQELSLNLGTLLDTGFNSDFKIKVRKLDSDEFAEIKVHKSILGARSDVLKAMLESPMQEQATGIMTIQDLSEDCVKLVMKWIYSGSLDDDWKKVPEEMVRAADMYRLTLLLDWLDKRLHKACDLENALILLKVAKLHGLTEATKNVTEFIRANFDKFLEDVVQGNV